MYIGGIEMKTPNKKERKRKQNKRDKVERRGGSYWFESLNTKLIQKSSFMEFASNLMGKSQDHCGQI